MINLAGNRRLKEFYQDALTVIPFDDEIKLHLILQDMDIIEVDRNMVDWHYVKSVDLNKNPLSCNCHMKWLQMLTSDSLIRSNLSALSVHAVCSSPEQLSGKNLTEIPVGALSCSSMLVTRFLFDNFYRNKSGLFFRIIFFPRS